MGAGLGARTGDLEEIGAEDREGTAAKKRGTGPWHNTGQGDAVGSGTRVAIATMGMLNFRAWLRLRSVPRIEIVGLMMFALFLDVLP